MTEMQARLREAVAALNRLEEAWDEEQVQNYPPYLPSFNDFIRDLDRMLDPPEAERPRSARGHLFPL